MGDKITAFNEIRKIKAGNKIIDFSKAIIMGIINVTPDSFFDGGKYKSLDNIISRAEKMLNEGATILDIGAVSTRPGADVVTLDEELKKIIEPVKTIAEKFPETVISVDTYRSVVAQEAIAAGAHIINDISGGDFDKNMFSTIAKIGVPYILMHIHGNPQTMQINPIENNIVEIVHEFFHNKVKELNLLGIENIILDPGFGFGKTLAGNYNLMKNMSSLRVNNLPLLSGISRKSMINKVLDTIPAEALNGTTVLNTISLINGANILRVHDVKEAVEAVKIYEMIK